MLTLNGWNCQEKRIHVLWARFMELNKKQTRLTSPALIFGKCKTTAQISLTSRPTGHNDIYSISFYQQTNNNDTNWSRKGPNARNPTLCLLRFHDCFSKLDTWSKKHSSQSCRRERERERWTVQRVNSVPVCDADHVRASVHHQSMSSSVAWFSSLEAR